MNKVNGRIRSFDLLRGYLILVIVVNHLALSPSIFQFATGRNLFWTSAAEGFFFLSGAMVGIVRGKGSFKVAAKKLLKRSAVLWSASAAVALSLTAMVLLLPGSLLGLVKPGFAPILSWGLVRDAALLRYIYGYADFLPYYTFFLLGSIPLLYALRNQLWWFVLAIGTIYWFEPRIINWGFYSYHFYWAAYFVYGLVFGYYYDRFLSWKNTVAKRDRMIIGNILMAVSACLVLCNYVVQYLPKISTRLVGIPLFGSPIASLGSFVRKLDQSYLQAVLMNNRSGVFRLLVFLVTGAGILVVFSRYEREIDRCAGRVLGLFGQQSLRTYIAHTYFVFVALLFFRPTNFVANSVTTAALLYILWLVIDRGWVKKFIPN